MRAKTYLAAGKRCKWDGRVCIKHFLSGLLIQKMILTCVAAAVPVAAAAWTTPVAIDVNTTTAARFDNSLSIASGAGTKWGAIWTANGDVGDEIGVLLSTSVDNGASWSSATEVSGTAGFPDGDFGDSPCIATDGGLNWIAAWDRAELLSGAVSARDIYFARSSDGGNSWSAPSYLNADHAAANRQSFGVSMDADAAGRCVAVWEASVVSPAVTYRPICWARSANAGADWSPVGHLDESTSGNLNSSPVVRAGGAGTWIAAWESKDTTDSDIVFSRSVDGGLTWTDGIFMNTHAESDNISAAFYDGQVQLATAGSGVWVSVWTSAYDPAASTAVKERVVYSRSIDDGASWSPMLPVDSTTSSLARQSPALCWDGTSFLAVWEKAGEMEYSRSTDLGLSWSPVAVLPPGTFVSSTNPQVAASSTRRSMAAWISKPASASGPDFAAATDVPPTAVAAEWHLY